MQHHDRAGPSDPADDTLASNERRPAPPVDVAGPLDKQLVKRALFPRRAGPVRIGRYTVLGLVGRGGMGVVYACYDDRLDRKIAVKVLHGAATPDVARARARLQREAQALARLSHPNVVAIHDVDVLDDQVYLAMEFVDGHTLGEWRRAAPRRWRDVLRVLLAAGEGLAAAHARGIVHRDIKPDNIMVGLDGRVRVMDFGLARAGDDPPPLPGLAGPRRDVLSDDLTRTDALMGTPAYMAPEQLRGETASPRTDQFCLCLTAWEALHGRRAYVGETLTELAAHMARGAPDPPPQGSDVPAWLRRVLERGLRPRAEDRFPDTPALLAALRADPTPRRRAALLAAGFAAAVAGGYGVHHAAEQRTVAACEAVAAAIDGDWNDEARADLERSFLATGEPFAAVSRERTAPWLDRWAAAWRDAAGEVCRAHTVDRRWDAELHARAVDCLDEARGQFTALVHELRGADALSLARSTAAAAALAPVDACVRPELLRDRTYLPGRWREFLPIRAQLAQAASLEAAGDLATGLQVARAATDAAKATGLAFAVAQAEYRAAYIAEALGDYREAEAGLRRSLAAAREARAPLDIFAATSRLALVVGHYAVRPAEGEVWAEAAQDQLALLSGDRPLEQARLDNYRGHIREDVGDAEGAIRLYTRALAAREAALGEGHPSVADMLSNLADLHRMRGELPEALRLFARTIDIHDRSTGIDSLPLANAVEGLALVHADLGDLDAAFAAYTRVLAIRTRVQGPGHPDIATSLANLGTLRAVAGDLDRARDMLTRALEVHRAAYGDDHPQVAEDLNNLATVHAMAGDHAAARPLLLRAIEILERRHGDAHPSLVAFLEGLASVQAATGELDAAIATYTRALALAERTGDHSDTSKLLHGLGAAHLAGGRPAVAVPLLERALALRIAQSAPAADLADTRFALARALAAADPARARSLAEQARDAATRRDEIDAWLAQRPT